MIDEDVDRPVFSEAHRLILIQLETRRAMATRAATNGRPIDTSASADRVGAASAPERWRLVPEGLALHAWQRDALPIWLAHGRGTVKVTTGGGKTLFALAAAERLQHEQEPDLRLVTVVPTIPLMHQWRDELRASDLSDAAIGDQIDPEAWFPEPPVEVWEPA